MDALVALTAAHLETFVLVFCRLGGMMVWAPVLGHRSIPVPHRAGLAALLLLIGYSVDTDILLTAGDFFGEGGLLTGEPRSATVVAEGEVTCYRLDRGGFSGILASRPEIAVSLAELLAKRRIELAEAKELLAGESEARGLATEQQDLLSKIKDFFKL